MQTLHPGLSTLWSALLIFLLALSTSCAGGERSGRDGSSDDDDDSAGDDDDSAGDDDDSAGDDDDSTGDDDDASGFQLGELTFGGTLVITPDNSAAGDDDDATGDDDDAAAGDDDDDSAAGDDDDAAAGDDDDSGSSTEFEATVTYTIFYWVDVEFQALNCRQLLRASGPVVFGFGQAPGCQNCTGFIDLDPATVEDISEPVTDPEHCDATTLDAADVNYGMDVLTPQTDGGMGDFLTMGLISKEAQAALGLPFHTNGSLTASELESQWSDVDLAYMGGGLINAVAGSLGDFENIDSFAQNEGAGSSWLPYWQIIANPETNPNTGSDWEGEYGFDSFWLIRLGE